METPAEQIERLITRLRFVSDQLTESQRRMDEVIEYAKQPGAKQSAAMKRIREILKGA